VGTAMGEIITAPLPPTDAEIPEYPTGARFIGFLWWAGYIKYMF